MKSKLRILAITLIMVLGFGLVSVNAEDATRYYIYVNGTELTSQTPSVTAGNGTVSYDATAKELTLNNATISSTMADATQGVISIRNDEAITIKLVGTNTITNTGASQGIDTTSNLTITGDGSLTITTDGIGVNGADDASLTIKDTTLNVSTTNYDALQPNGGLVIDNSAVDLKATNSAAINAWTSVEIKNLTNKIFQKSNKPITADTEASDPSRFNPEYGYHYVKISNKGILSKIAITLKEPVVGETPSTGAWTAEPTKDSVNQGVKLWFKIAKDDYVSIIEDRDWYKKWTQVKDDEKFQKDYYYAFITAFEPDEDSGYVISDDITVTLNGKKLSNDEAIHDEGWVEVIKVFGPLAEKSPATGDNNELGLFAVAGLISVAGVALMLRRKHSM